MLPAKQGAPFRDQYQSPQPKGKSAQQLICLISIYFIHLYLLVIDTKTLLFMEIIQVKMDGGRMKEEG